MSEQTWKTNVKKYNGAFVVWVDQSSDTLLKEENSKGVCAAMSFDFVTAYQMGNPGPYNFLNDIRDTALIPPDTNRIPQKYIDIQAALKAMTDQYNENIRQLTEQYNQAKREDKPELLRSISELKNNRIKTQYGPGMGSVTSFTQADSDLAPLELFVTLNDIVENKGPSYFYIGMHRDGGAHAISFGFRPDLSASSQFPGIYEFFDANLGQFTFGTEEKLSDFFSDEVWAQLYKTRGYKDFDVVSFPAHKNRR
ncbi:MAG: YopT-type cysteine protease domain-containing protein [Bacteroidota bacterium]